MKDKHSIQTKFLNKMIFIVFISIGLWCLVWVQDEYFTFKSQSEQMREAYVKSQKVILKKEVNTVVTYIGNMKKIAEQNLESSLKERVYEAHQIATNIYGQNFGSKDLSEIKKMIKDALRPIRFNDGRGYYFAVSMEGVEQLYPINPEFEGNNLIDLQDSKGNFVVQEEIKVVKEKGEGFVRATWTKPDKNSLALYPKLSFVKQFKPLNWYLGTGDYLDDFEARIKEEILNRLVDFRFGTDGYFFGSTYQGDPLFSNGKMTIGFKNIWNLTDPDGVKIIQGQRKAAENPGGGFVYYAWNKIDTTLSSPKISFVQNVSEWEWTIGAGTYLDTIEKDILENKAVLAQGLKKRMTRSILMMGVLLCLVYVWSRRISGQIEKSIETFSSLLKKASIDSFTINPKDLPLSEFRDIAVSTNKILIDRRQVEKELKYSNLLEAAVAKVSRLFAFYDKVEYKTVLQIMGESVSANRAYVFKIQNGGDKISNTVEWCDSGTLPQIDMLQNLEIGIFSWWMTQLRNGENIIIENIDDLPVEASTEKKNFQDQKIRSLAAVPIWSRNRRLLGFMGFDDTDKTRVWSESEIEMLQVVGEMISNDRVRRASEDKIAYFGHIFENSINEIYLFDRDTLNFVQVNQAAQNNLGYTLAEFLKLTPLDVHPKLTPRSFSKQIRLLINGEKDSIVFESIHKRKDHSFYDVEVHLQLLNYEQKMLFTAIVIDISQRKKLEIQLQQTQKMEAIGTLAGGIAHDFNNILFPVIGFSEMIMHDLPEDSPIKKQVQAILDGASRAKNLVQQILTFSRQTVDEARPLKIEFILNEVLTLARASFPSTIKITKDIQKRLGMVMADPTQIHQVAMNLITNALHAMEENGGDLRVALSRIDVADTSGPVSDMLPGPYLCLEVSDTGTGMDAYTRTRILEPYFTTKAKGKGTGLGLSVVHGIVKNLQGELIVESQAGKGASFLVYLPLITPKKEEDTNRTIPLVQLNGNERILLVDDERPVIEMLEQMLLRFGYQVTPMDQSLEALNLFGRMPDEFDLVITDMTMPELTGDKLIMEIKKLRPDIPVILCTGFSEKIINGRIKNAKPDKILMKPVAKDELLKNIRFVLDKPKLLT